MSVKWNDVLFIAVSDVLYVPQISISTAWYQMLA